ncbi:hypothetical protein DRE_04750 [Drechslerella stenobrocha 248]|uniref:Nucleolar protein 12 n=1 Tax=Drechslerella stenobrocha 248 TaxID=1043628 RepID=W7I0G2_9PEZI|nr:hypothetical protein DRE_04750 [Drechslerella stenobrocha 248]
MSKTKPDADSKEDKKHREEKKDKEHKKDKKGKTDKKQRKETTLFGATPNDVDEGLASLFSTNAGPVDVAAARTRRPVRPSRPTQEADGIDLSSDESADDETQLEVRNALAARDQVLRQDSKKKRKRTAEPAIEDAYMDKLRDDDDEDDEPEAGKKKKKQKKEPIGQSPRKSDAGSNGEPEEEMNEQPDPDTNPSDDDDSDDDSDDSDGAPPARIAHETEGGIQQQELEKANRTVFIGNLPSTVITDKSHYKTLKTAFKTHGPISSVRFRSIAFSDQIPRKAAFVTKALHVDQTTVNAYIVFTTADAARTALTLNGTVLLSHHLRVDSIAHPAKNDSRRCVFVGNLDFEAAEESLWRHFGTCGTVQNVRLVRDPKTNVGKGFAYVQFDDEICVEKALLLDGKPMQAEGKPQKRKLRVTRAKNLRRKATPGSAPVKSPHHKRTDGAVYVPKPDPKREAMAGRAGKLFGRAGGAKLRKVEDRGAFEGTRAVPGMDAGLRSGGSGKRKGEEDGAKRGVEEETDGGLVEPSFRSVRLEFFFF